MQNKQGRNYGHVLSINLIKDDDVYINACRELFENKDKLGD